MANISDMSPNDNDGQLNAWSNIKGTAEDRNDADGHDDVDMSDSSDMSEAKIPYDRPLYEIDVYGT